ncbi:MAG: glycosyltransferase [Acidimicrobiales bacterium]|nr:glycosyltransferase [Acidimicrobiales bacterium]HRW39328.1 glycosyltransferase [Aquihabitans sp.]
MSGPVVWILAPPLGAGGAPTMLVRYLRWLRSPAGCADGTVPEVHVVAGADGTSAAEVTRLAESTTLLGPAEGRSVAGTVAAAGAQLGHEAAAAAVWQRWARRRVRHLPRPDVVVVHGAGAWPLWRAVAPRCGRARLVLHLHELSVAIGRSVPASERWSLAAEPDAIAAPCRPDAGLRALLGARADEVVVVPECAEPPTPNDLQADARLVVGIGEAGWRKGTDRFEALAHELARRRPEVACQWIGAPPPPGWALADDDAGPVHWDGWHPDPWARVPPRAVVVVPSREDPLPLVAIEAARRGHAVVASGDGGLADLLDEGRGWFVASADVRDLADAAEAALDEAATTGLRAARLRAHADAHLAPEAVGPRWLALITGRPAPPVDPEPGR